MKTANRLLLVLFWAAAVPASVLVSLAVLDKNPAQLLPAAVLMFAAAGVSIVRDLVNGC